MFLKEALKLNSNDARAFFQLGTAHKLSGDLEKARLYFMKTSEIDPKHNKAMSELRLIHRRLGDQKKSESTFMKLFKKKKQ